MFVQYIVQNPIKVTLTSCFISQSALKLMELIIEANLLKLELLHYTRNTILITELCMSIAHHNVMHLHQQFVPRPYQQEDP